MRLGFLSSMAALLAGTGLVLGQAPDYQYVQSGSLPARSLPAGTTTTVVMQNAPEAGNGATTVAVPGNGTYDCLGCNSGCGAGGCGIGGGCASGFCENTTQLCHIEPYSCYGKFELLMWNIARTPLQPNGGLPLQGSISVTTTDGGALPETTTFDVPVSAIVNAATGGGDSRLGGEHLGSRITLGMWLDSQSHCGLEVSAFVIERRSSRISNSVGPQQLSAEEGQIFIPTPNPSDDTVLNANFFLVTGASDVTSTVGNSLWGFEINGRCGRYYIGCFSFGTLAGFRYLDFEEDLITSTSASLTFASGSAITEVIVPDLGDPVEVTISDAAIVNTPLLVMSSFDSVQTRNTWYGYQVGTDFEWGCGPCFLNGFLKFGLGAMHQAADVLSTSNPDANGHHTRNRISGIMEGSISIGYAFSPAIRTYLGYDYLYMMRVARPNNLLANATNDLAVNVAGTDVVFDQTLVPVFRFTDRDMWVQGIHFGTEFRY